MNNKTIIAIDAMGGENAPAKNIEGLAIFLKKNKDKNDFFFNLYGDETLIRKELSKFKIQNNIYEIFHSTTTVSDEETPLTAIKNSKDSSMWNAINSQTELNSNITLSAGNTGVLFVISRMLLKTIESVSKPALAGLWPNKKNMNVVLDLGANVDCDDKNLVDFSEMGAALYKALFPEDTARVALLNIGSEEIKGTENLKKAYSKLKEISKYGDFQFDGFIEGNKITNGDSNVIVTDGFTGNIALKTAEGTAKFIIDSLKHSLTETLLAKFSIIFSYFALKKFKSKLDPRKFNGAIFLGLKGPVVKSHGSTDATGFYYSIDLCYRISKGDLMNKILNNLSHGSASK
ncbi:phosphate acyltransferase PlsX [Pelagibacteraceae bacterium]|nr:phosphate acyltransferase PlsX [Pelagibacteraceae bacterium]